MLHREKSYSLQEVILPDLKGLFPYPIHLIKSMLVTCEEICLETTVSTEEGQKVKSYFQMYSLVGSSRIHIINNTLRQDLKLEQSKIKSLPCFFLCNVQFA